MEKIGTAGMGGVAMLGIASWLWAGCASYNPDGAPPSEAKPPIDYPHGHRIFFRDGETRHVVALYDDGSYLFRSGNDYDGVLATRDGRWSWKKIGTHNAVLTLDTDVWQLTFVGPDSATAVNRSAAGTTHAFQFEPM